MGFFGKLKQNFTHGGVKIALKAPASVSMNDASFAATVDITATDAPQTIKSVRLQLIAESSDQAFSEPTATGMNNTQHTTNQIVAQSSNAEPFSLAAGETKTVQLQLVMNSGKALQDALPDGGMKEFAGALQKLQSVSEAMNKANYTYYVQATADVDGVALDPSKRQPIQVLRPGEIGGGVNVNL